MPGLTGFDVAAMVRADPDTHGVPILVLSVLTDPQRGVRLGVDRYLTKPVLGSELVPVVESLLRRAELPRRVLVVDPSPEHAQKVRAVLESERCTVVGTVSVADALPQARALLPDLVVVGANAVGLVQALRDDAALMTVPVVELVPSG